MAVVDFSRTASDPGATRELREHQRSFDVFLSVLFFAVAHVALTLGSIALAFLADAHVVAWLVWLGGTLLLIVLFTMHRASVATVVPRNR